MASKIKQKLAKNVNFFQFGLNVKEFSLNFLLFYEFIS